jgi:hypothetical protein
MRSTQQSIHPTSLGFEFLCINDLHKGSQKNVGSMIKMMTGLTNSSKIDWAVIFRRLCS